MSWEKHTVPGTGIDFVDYSPWNRRTIADGTWLQNNTIAPIYHNEEILASAIYDSSANLHFEISAASGSLKNTIKNTSAYLQDEIDTMKAATDVVDVVDSYSALLSYSGEYITYGDIVKVLDCYASSSAYSYSGEQVYWRYKGPDVPPGPYDSGKWEPVGSLSPYYSKSEVDRMFSDTSGYIDSKISVVSGDLDDVSGAVSNSAQYLYELISETSGKGKGNDIWRLWLSEDSGTKVSGWSYYPQYSVKVKFPSSSWAWDPYSVASANICGTMTSARAPSLPPNGVYRWNAEIVFKSINPLRPYFKGYDISVEWDKPNSLEKNEEFLSTIYFDMSTKVYQHNYIGGIVSTIGNTSASDLDFYIKPKDNDIEGPGDGLEVGQIKMGRLWVNQIG